MYLRVKIYVFDVYNTYKIIIVIIIVVNELLL